MNKEKKEFPCCDLLSEARLEGQELIHILSLITKELEYAYRAGDYDGDEESCKRHAKASKEAIHDMQSALMKIRDKITFWQAWANDNSPIN